MKCPYNNFKECIVEKCPSCRYEEVKKRVISGRYPSYMDLDTAIKMGYAWEETKITYKFIACQLVDNSAQPLPQIQQTISNTTRTNIVIKRSIF